MFLLVIMTFKVGNVILSFLSCETWLLACYDHSSHFSRQKFRLFAPSPPSDPAYMGEGGVERSKPIRNRHKGAEPEPQYEVLLLRGIKKNKKQKTNPKRYHTRDSPHPPRGLAKLLLINWFANLRKEFHTKILTDVVITSQNIYKKKATFGLASSSAASLALWLGRWETRCWISTFSPQARLSSAEQ